MARKKHLINVHTGTGTTTPTGASLYLGEIAVQHTPTDPALWIKTGTAEESETYEKFIGETKILELIQTSDILGSGYTYSGLPYVNSATTIADAYSALTKELLDDEEVISSSLNDLNNRIIEVSGSVSNIHVDMILGSGYTYTGIPYVTSATSIADAYSAITDELLATEEYMVDKVEALSGSIENLEAQVEAIIESPIILGEEYTYSGLPYVNSATTLAEAYSALTHELIKDERVISEAFNDLNDRVTELEGETPNDGVLTVKHNGATAGTFSANASANTEINITTNDVPASTSSDSGKVLMVNSNGVPEWVYPANIYSGNVVPPQSLGNNGDIYLQTS